ncbi:DUF3413 domain-containing protein [Shewanella aestuarii]|uniref:DUF3413 domain-containing protein n=1 Tax=Shewanella aestuarii TaxID=1028752 RepID=A0A6G9QLU5_9GAMM|nr:DUF3413 domain-containing protein [Shewanella aestuarii]QIR14829.1 DUF3413 domain-containing protein [Shewanella aestuarii]
MSERKKQMARDKVSRLVNWGHWFAFFNGLLAMLIGSRYISSVGQPDSLISWGYLTLSTIGHFTFLAFIVYIVFIFPITLILPYSKILRGYAAFIASMALYTLLYDTVIYNDYGVHLSPFAFDLAWQDLNALLHSTSYIVTPIVILIIELIAANFIWKRIDKIQKQQWGHKLVLFVGACFISSHLIHIWADATNVTDITRFDDTYPISYPATAKTFMESHGVEGNTAFSDPENYVSNISYPIEPLQCQADKHPNVLLISIDSLRKDMVDELTMPFLSQYAKQALKFNQHYTGGTNFDTSMFSLLYGLQGNYSDKQDFNYLAPVLTQQLHQQGYQLSLFTGRHQQSLLNINAMFTDFTPFISNDEDGSASADIQSINALQNWKTHQTTPWFALLNLSAPRNYDTPVGFLGIETIKSPADLKPAQKVLFNQYRQSLRFVDEQLQQLLSNTDKDTVVIITGTNGQVFTSDMDDARRDLSPANVKVPLIIYWPNIRANEINHRTSHYGIAPTILSKVLGCTTPAEQYSSGRSLLEPNQETWIYIGNSREFAIYQKNEITVLGRYGKYRIYDLNYDKRLRKKMSAPELIQVMREGRRFYNQ